MVANPPPPPPSNPTQTETDPSLFEWDLKVGVYFGGDGADSDHWQ